MELESAVMVDPQIAPRGLKYLQEILDQFKDEDYHYRVIFQEYIGRLHMRTGQVEQAEAVFRRILEDNPQSARGYVLLAEAWTFPLTETSAEDRHRAADILRQALAYPVTDAADFDVASRLKDLSQS